MDEPVSGLDVTLQQRMLQLLKTLQHTYGFAMVVVSHNLNVVRVLCDQVGVMLRGELVETGATVNILGDGATHPYTQALIASNISLAESSVKSYFPNPLDDESDTRYPL